MSPVSPPLPAAVDVVVVGAGITGLRCAEGLARAGRGVLVLEARERVGGRLWSPRAGDPPAPLDLGATWFWSQEPRIRALIGELDLPTHEQHLRGDALYEDHRGVQRLAGNPIDVASGRFSEGAQGLAEALAERLPAGTIRTSCPVASVIVPGDRARVETARGGLDARMVVLALPPALAVSSMAFEPPLPESLARLAMDTPVWMGATAKVVVRYGEPFWRRTGLAGAAVNHRGPLREIHDMSGPEGPPAALFGFASPPGSPEGAERSTEAAVVAQLTRLFGPEAGRPQSVRIADWSRERWTTPQGSGTGSPVAPRYDLYGHPLFQRPVHGLVHLASTETARAFAGHIEGALVAADDTVRRIVEAWPADDEAGAGSARGRA